MVLKILYVFYLLNKSYLLKLVAVLKLAANEESDIQGWIVCGSF